MWKMSNDMDITASVACTVLAFAKFQWLALISSHHRRDWRTSILMSKLLSINTLPIDMHQSYG